MLDPPSFYFEMFHFLKESKSKRADKICPGYRQANSVPDLLEGL
jgi:hypothetical protein